jgi:hypothetical protein
MTILDRIRRTGRLTTARTPTSRLVDCPDEGHAPDTYAFAVGARYRRARRARRQATGVEHRRPSDTPTLDATYAAALHDEAVDFQRFTTQRPADLLWLPFAALFRAVTRYTGELERKPRKRS